MTKEPFHPTALETHIHSVRRRVFTPDSPKLIIFFHFSNQRTPTKWAYLLLQYNNNNPQQSKKQYEHNNNNQFAQRLLFDPIILALPHPITVLL